MRWVISAALGVSLALGSLPALAQTVVSRPDIQLARVHLRTVTPMRSLEVRSKRDGATLARCQSSCVVELPHGVYHVVIPPTAGSARGTQNLVVDGSGTWAIQDADRDAAMSGLALGIAGTVMIPAGLVITMLSTLSARDGEGSTSPASQRWATAGVATLITGVVLTPVGWTMFARNRRPKVLSALSGVDVRMALGPNHGVLGLSASF